MAERNDGNIEAPLNEEFDYGLSKERKYGCVLSGLAFFLSYVFSAGPAVFIVDRTDLSIIGRALQFLYYPLIVLVKSDVPLIAPVLRAWISLFK